MFSFALFQTNLWVSFWQYLPVIRFPLENNLDCFLFSMVLCNIIILTNRYTSENTESLLIFPTALPFQTFPFLNTYRAPDATLNLVGNLNGVRSTLFQIKKKNYFGNISETWPNSVCRNTFSEGSSFFTRCSISFVSNC